jgi:hypothetical protein
MNKNYNLSKDVEIIFETPKDASYFFGYYDKSPLNIKDNLLLTHKVAFDGRPVSKNDEAEIGYWDIATKKYKKLASTKAFNWQQGSMLQWLPPNYDNEIIYNDFDGEHFISYILDIHTGSKRKIPFPIYDIHPSGKYAIAINYERYYFARDGYSYDYFGNKFWDEKIHPKDGVFKVDLKTGNYKLLISLKDIVQFEKNHLDENKYHYLEILKWSPDGSKFIFFHRWNDKNKNFKTRLFSYDIKSKKLFLFPLVDTISHFNWKNNNEFTVWASVPTLSTSIVRNINNNLLYKKLLRPFYQLIKTKFLKKQLSHKLPNTHFLNFHYNSEEYNILGSGQCFEDGHNTWTKNQRYMLVDTYQNEQGYRQLNLFDDASNQIINLGEFYSSYNDSVFRCDLHPRFSHDEKKVIIDSAHEDKRAILILDIRKAYN